MHQVTLDPVEQVKLTWMVDWPEKNVFFQVKNGISERYSWFAIGFSRRGEFPRTDFCIFQRESERIDINIVSHKSPLLLRSTASLLQIGYIPKHSSDVTNISCSEGLLWEFAWHG